MKLSFHFYNADGKYLEHMRVKNSSFAYPPAADDIIQESSLGYPVKVVRVDIKDGDQCDRVVVQNLDGSVPKRYV